MLLLPTPTPQNSPYLLNDHRTIFKSCLMSNIWLNMHIILARQIICFFILKKVVFCQKFKLNLFSQILIDMIDKPALKMSIMSFYSWIFLILFSEKIMRSVVGIFFYDVILKEMYLHFCFGQDCKRNGYWR